MRRAKLEEINHWFIQGGLSSEGKNILQGTDTSEQHHARMRAEEDSPGSPWRPFLMHNKGLQHKSSAN